MALTKAHNRMIEGSAVNVIDYGAVGDGVTDDSAAIQAALDTGNEVYFPQGTYYCASTISYTSGKKPVRMVGVGDCYSNQNGSVIKFASGLQKGLSLNMQRTAAGGYIRGITLEGQGSSPDYGLYVVDTRGLKVIDCKFSNFDHGVFLDNLGTAETHVLSFLFDRCYFTGNDTAGVYNNTWRGSGQSNDNTFQNCKFYNNGYGYYSDFVVENNTRMVSCVFEANTNINVYLYHVWTFSMIGCYFENNNYTQDYLVKIGNTDAGNVQSHAITFLGNNFQGPVTSGVIYLARPRGASVDNTFCSGHGGTVPFIYIDGSYDQVRIERPVYYLSNSDPVTNTVTTSGGETSTAQLFNKIKNNTIRSASSGYVSSPLILGSYYFWVDSTGDFRIKSGAPTSDTDGTVVGTQS